MSQCGNWQKYQNRNPLQRLLIRRFVNVVIEMTAPLTFTAVLDAGSGEGFVSQRLLHARPSVQVVGVDIDKGALERGRGIHPDIAFQFGDVNALPFEENSFDLVICNEVLEHVEYPEQALAEICRVSKRYCLVSVPYEPVFCLMNLLRGKNLTRFGNDVDHHNLWSARTFRHFAAEHLKLIDSRYPLPWQVHVAECRKM